MATKIDFGNLISIAETAKMHGGSSVGPARYALKQALKDGFLSDEERKQVQAKLDELEPQPHESEGSAAAEGMADPSGPSRKG